MIDLTMNLINEINHECERRKNHIIVLWEYLIIFLVEQNEKLEVMDLKEELGNLENVKDLLDSELIIDYVVPPLLLQLVSV